jgi:hypothetical protein
MADRDRRISLKFVEIDVQVGAANPRRTHLDYNLPGAGLRFRDIQYVYVPGSTRSFTYRKHREQIAAKQKEFEEFKEGASPALRHIKPPMR